jgi:hypothetical protein
VVIKLLKNILVFSLGLLNKNIALKVEIKFHFKTAGTEVPYCRLQKSSQFRYALILGRRSAGRGVREEECGGVRRRCRRSAGSFETVDKNMYANSWNMLIYA